MPAEAANHKVTQYAITAAFGGFIFGLDAANISGAVRFVSAQFGLTSLQIGTLVGCAIVGVILALFFTGALCERYGRKKILMAIALTYFASSVLSAFALNYEMLVAGRFIGGIAFASLTVSAMYMGEISPPEVRGRFVSVSQLLITLGSLLAFIVNYFLVLWLPTSGFLTPENIWRFMLGFAIVPNFLWVLSLIPIPESPRWLIKKGRTDEARRVFAQIIPAAQLDATMQSVEESLAQDAQDGPLTQLRNLFGRQMRYVLMVAVVYAIVQGATGMNAVLFFAPTVFEQIGMSVEDTFLQTIVLGAVAVLCTLIAIAFVERWGRRALTIAGLALVVVAHGSTWYGFSNASYTLDQAAAAKIAGQGLDVARIQPLIGRAYDSDVALKADLATIYTNQELPIVSGPIINATIEIEPLFVLFGIFAFLAAFNMSIGPIMWVIFSEIFPNSVRSVALPFAALVQSISSYLIQQFFPWQLENLGAASTFLVYGLIGLVGLIVMILILPETKGKSIEQIGRTFAGH